jgi:hypothetical protein
VSLHKSCPLRQASICDPFFPTFYKLEWMQEVCRQRTDVINPLRLHGLNGSEWRVGYSRILQYLDMLARPRCTVRLMILHSDTVTDRRMAGIRRLVHRLPDGMVLERVLWIDPRKRPYDTQNSTVLPDLGIGKPLKFSARV